MVVNLTSSLSRKRIHYPSAWSASLVFTSLFKKYPVTIVERISAIGNAIHTPQTPKNGGNIRIKGIKKNPCFVRLKSKAGTAFPID